MTTSPPRTPPLLWVLGLLVVGATWWGWSHLRSQPGSQLDRWSRERLTLEDIGRGLDSPEFDEAAHALVQFGVRSQELRRKGSTRAVLGPLLPKVEALLAAKNPRLRSLAAMAVAYVDDPGVTARLLPLLEDEDGKVSLNAALALAARGESAGAARLGEALETLGAEDVAGRRALLEALAPVARPAQRELLQRERDRARLDGDEALAALCEKALRRL